jgi:hypothetical protein
VGTLPSVSELTTNLGVVEMRLHLALEYRGREVQGPGLLILQVDDVDRSHG